MKKLSICILALAMMVGTAMAENYAIDVNADPSDKNFQTSVALDPTLTTTFDVYLRGVTVNEVGGAFYLDWTGQTADASFVSVLVADGVGIPGPWANVSTNVLGDVVGGPGSLAVLVGNIATAAPDGDGDLIIARVTLQCDAPGVDVPILVDLIPSMPNWTPTADSDVVGMTFTMEQQGCDVDADCSVNNDLWCDGAATCVAGVCVVTDGDPCDDANDCTIDTCEEAATPGDTEAGTCSYECAATSGVDPCCEDPACAGFALCDADVTIIKESSYYQPPAPGQLITIKNRICLDNPSVLVGGIQFDICDEPDCLECIDCELTERTVMFDCVVLELPDGCCRVIMFCKNPGCAINPGLCNIVTVVMQTKEGAPEECGEICIDETIENIVVSDYDGFAIAGAGVGGALCPISCGDVCPPGSGTANDCGDGVVDIYDIMCEVDFALTLTTPNDCQLPRADVPTGTPPNCTAPDGSINILDIMVLIDMALNRQDCCSFYYLGIIY